MGNLTANIDKLVALPDYEGDWEKDVPYAFGPLAVVIEYLAGDARTKVKDNGAVVTGVMPVAYGYILRTTDIHGEEIDMYLASTPSLEAPIWVIDQVYPDTGEFDEHKVMLGFDSVDEVIHTYLQVFGDGSGGKRLGAITRFPGETFVDWAQLDGSSLQPASKYETNEVQTQVFRTIGLPKRQNPPKLIPIDEAGGVVITLPSMNDGPKLITTSSEVGAFDYHLHILSALDTQCWSNTVDTFCRTLHLASEKDTMHIHLSTPGGSVFLMGRMCSAIKATKAKVITYAEGQVASAGTTIWAAGHERHILPGAFFMQHMSSQFMMGKSTDIVAKVAFCANYIKRQLALLVDIGLFTIEEVSDMAEKHSDIFISGRDAIARVGAISASR